MYVLHEGCKQGNFLFTSSLHLIRILLMIVRKIMETDFQMEVMDREEAERELGASGGRGRTSQYEPVAQKWGEVGDDESIVLSGLEQNDIQNLRNLLYRRFGKENVIVRSAQQEDETFKAVVRAREGNEYLRDGE